MVALASSLGGSNKPEEPHGFLPVHEQNDPRAAFSLQLRDLVGTHRLQHALSQQVSGEPVSGANSLLAGKFTGNFTKIGLLRENLPDKTQQNQLVRG
jgi:hypothetical protein